MSARHTPAQIEPHAAPLGTVHAQDLDAQAPEFTALYRHYYKLVWHAAWKFGANDDNVDDLVQETFLVVLRRLPDFESRGANSTSAWLIRTLRNIMRNQQRGHARRMQRQREYSELAQRRYEDSSVTERQLAKQQFADFLESLDPRRREVFILAEFGGYDSHEIGKTLSIKPGTARSRLHAARISFEAAFPPEIRPSVEAELASTCVRPPPPDARRRRLTLQALAAAGAGKLAPTGGITVALGISAWLGKAIVVGTGLAVTVGIIVISIDENHFSDELPAAAATPVTTTASDDPSELRIEVRSISEPLNPIEVHIPHGKPSPPAIEPDPASAAARERAWDLADARKALLDDRPELTLAIIREHSNWPNSAMAARAISLELSALCTLKRGAEAKGRFESWRAMNPDTDLDDRVENICW